VIVGYRTSKLHPIQRWLRLTTTRKSDSQRKQRN